MNFNKIFSKRMLKLFTTVASRCSFCGLCLLNANCSSSGFNSYGTTDNSNSQGSFSTPAPVPITGAPLVLYTDIISGPNSGGENNKGAYLSIFGKNFGSGELGSSIRVFINNVEVDNYRSLGSAKSRPDIQQISVQIGSLGNPPPGLALPIRVSVNGVNSNLDQTFIVNPGRFFFIDPANGNDSTGVIGDITHPFKTVQQSNYTEGTWGQVQSGDFIILRKGTHIGKGVDNYFIRFITKTSSVYDSVHGSYGYGSGVAPTGMSGSGPISVMAYPNEDAFVNCDGTLGTGTNPNGCFSGLNGNNFPVAGKWVVIANLRIEGGGYDGPISQQVAGDHWRIVNNEITAYTGVTWPQADAYNAAHSGAGAAASRMAGITGNGIKSFWVGNHIHDINGSDCSHLGSDNLPSPNCSGSEAHGIYIDGEGQYEIAYNNIHDIHSGKGFQAYATGGNSLNATAANPSVSDVSLHHNIIHDVLTYGINVADSSTTNWVISNNIVYNAKIAALAFNTMSLVSCKIYHNTLVGRSVNNWGALANAVDARNNIMSGEAFGPGNLDGTFNNNLWRGSAVGSMSMDPHAIYGDPLFISLTDFHLNAKSPGILAGTQSVYPLIYNDFDITTPRLSSQNPDIGAYQH